MFTHGPLAQEPPHIRLIRLRQPETVDGAVADSRPAVSLDIKHETLDRASGNYVALSYVWGDVKANPVNILVNGQQFQIGRNLHDALVALQDKEQVCQSWIWVDSLCIHQSNDTEKTTQVALMGDIFRQAFMVCSWLGASSQDVDTAMDFISTLGRPAVEAGALEPTAMELLRNFDKYVDDRTNQSQTAGEAQVMDDAQMRLCSAFWDLVSNFQLDDLQKQESITRGLQALLLKDYWHRVWIIQEAALNDNTMLFCGNKVLSIDAFEAVLESRRLIWTVSTKTSLRRKAMRGIFDGTPANSGDITALAVRTDRRHGFPIRLPALIVRFDVGPGRPHYSATDPRDIVSGLLGIVTDKEQLGLQPDYTQTASQILTTLTRALFEKDDTRCFCLDNVVPRSPGDPNLLGLPSWVPDWPRIGSGKTGNDAWAMNSRGLFDATPGTRQKSYVPDIQQAAQNPTVLIRRGCYVDVITEVMEPPRYIARDEWSASMVANAPEWLQRVVEFTGLGPEISSADDHVWRTLLGDRMLLPDSKANPSTVAESRAWLHRHFLRQIRPKVQDLPENVARDMLDGLYNIAIMKEPEMASDLEKQLEFLTTELPEQAGALNRGRTLFKTEQGVESPIVLKRLSSGPEGERFWFKGDVHVDGIMRGEFLETKPAEAVFHLV
ncbi:heterokaryon incompatibility protein-domain-containing protein [Plectosphaerella cucumerina]|uniref:Heterokaryon incompatibility protein-domain-containing protein n=1 Tax=Plectosphaerella cucumerina TaxID=40658 RepID=A0A8K0TRG7_9PEZI|nr:heterokaryon incompatibility protein-domain-containing protein [Plectosphaerella cucumerina]